MSDGRPVGARPHILIADGDADTRSLYREVLAHRGTIDEAADGAEALAKAGRQPPTLVITELRLPHVDGYALCRTLRAQGTTRHTKMLVVTASAFETPLERAVDAGADEVLLKPCALDRLLARVDALLCEGGAQDAHGEALPATPPLSAGAIRTPSYLSPGRT